jgi:hypothetical protein
MPKPYRSDGKQTMSPIEVKRAELAKKKAEIIKGQNSRTAAGSAGGRMESLKGASSTNPRSGRL